MWRKWVLENDMLTVGNVSTTIENCINIQIQMRKNCLYVFEFHHLKVDYKNQINGCCNCDLLS